MISRARRLIIAAAAVAAASVVVGPAEPAVAAPTHVGIVVRFADGSTATACTTVGGSGYDVLERRYRITIGRSGPYAGFLLQISQQPANPHPDSSHYWSYWRSSGNGGWAYSGSGAGSSDPEAGTVEGWSYVNGQSNAPKPAPYTYAGLCGSSDPTSKPTTTTPEPKPGSAARSTTPERPAKPVTRTAPAAGTDAASTPAPTGRKRTQAIAASPSHAGASPASMSSLPISSQPASTAPASTTAVPTAVVSRVAAAQSASTSEASSGFPTWGTGLAIVVVLGIGAAAVLRTRRRTE